MAANVLNVTNAFSVTINGVTYVGKQGAIAGSASDAFAYTIDGAIHLASNPLATATVVTVYDDDDDKPVDFNYLFFWADVDMYIQIIGSGTNVIFKQMAFMPYVMAHPGTVAATKCGMLAAANTTIMTGGTEPTLTDIDSVVLGNYSGSTGNYFFAVID